MPLFDTVEVSSADALVAVERYHADYATSGLCPFIIGDAGDLKQLHDLLQPPADGGAACIAEAAAFDLTTWRASAHAKKPKSVAKGVDPQAGFASLIDLLTGEPKPRVHIGLVRVARPEHLFAVLGFGDWNDCPPAHVHVALHHHWNLTYGAIPVTLSDDVVECFVPNPPTANADVLALAAEHFAYCYDIVEQGFGSKSKLAASLVAAKTWYFWWD